MISIRHYIVALYSLVMISKICHLNANSHSKPTFEIIKDHSESDSALKTFSKSFSSESFNHFSSFSLVKQNGRNSLFVVCKNDTIIQLAIESMEVINIFRKHVCPFRSKYDCEGSVTINVLSEISLLNQKMLWYCYILSNDDYHSPRLTNCLVPKNHILPEDLKWIKKGYSSTNSFYQTFSVQTVPYIFIGSYTENSLLIIRTKLPNVLGKIDASQDLETPTAEFYFEKNSHFLEAFNTMYEVYFVIHEPITSKSHTLLECVPLEDTRTVVNTRLIRICKDDPGGVAQFTEKNFGTAAKANIVCPIGSGTDQYHFTRSISASWSGSKLYVLFETQKNSPPGKVLCVYDAFAFNVAFNSEIIPPKIFSNINNKIDNPIKDICKKLTEQSLTESEKLDATSLATNGLYRFTNVLPITSVPLLNLRNYSYTSVKTFRINDQDHVNLIVLIAKSNIRVMSHMEDDSVCHIQDYRLDEDESISQVNGDHIGSMAFIFISTNKRMLQIKLSVCQKYENKIACLQQAPSICGWDSRRNKCTLLDGDVDQRSWKRSGCKLIRFDDVWSLPEKCRVNKDDAILSCTIKYCLDETQCAGGNRIHITDCSNTVDDDTFGDWGPWSKCITMTDYQNRTRKCIGTKCSGATVDYRKCHFTSNIVSTTHWTKWYQSPNTKYHVSLRARCPINQILPPMIEERVKLCGEACSENSEKLSDWSECVDANIQYRLLNCTSFDSCPFTRTEVKTCRPPLRKQQYLQGGKDSGYSIIHIVLAILIASLVWLAIITLVSVTIFCYNQKRKSRRRTRQSRHSAVSNPRYQQSFYQRKPVLSETSNEYLSPDIPSSSYNHNNTDISFTSTINIDQATHRSNTFYSRFPLLNVRHSHVSDI